MNVAFGGEVAQPFQNRQLVGWATFYKFTDFTARAFRHIDHVVFWKMAHWLARKYRSRIKPLMRK